MLFFMFFLLILVNSRNHFNLFIFKTDVMSYNNFFINFICPFILEKKFHWIFFSSNRTIVFTHLKSHMQTISHP